MVQAPDIMQRQSFFFLPIDEMDGQEILGQAAVAMSTTVYAIHARASFLKKHPDMLTGQHLDDLTTDLDTLRRLLQELEMLFDMDQSYL